MQDGLIATCAFRQLPIKASAEIEILHAHYFPQFPFIIALRVTEVHFIIERESQGVSQLVHPSSS